MADSLLTVLCLLRIWLTLLWLTLLRHVRIRLTVLWLTLLWLLRIRPNLLWLTLTPLSLSLALGSSLVQRRTPTSCLVSPLLAPTPAC